MANTYTQIYIQTVFAVENRTSLLKESWREELHKYITGIVQNKKHKLIAQITESLTTIEDKIPTKKLKVQKPFLKWVGGKTQIINFCL